MHMRIALFSDAFLPTVDGVAIALLNTARLLSERHKVLLFIPSGSDTPRIKNVGYVLLRSIPLKKYREYRSRIPSFAHVYAALRDFRPDLVHIHSIFGIGWEGLLCAKLLHIPTVVTAHTIFPEVAAELDIYGLTRTEGFRMVSWRYMIAFLNRAEAIITPSEVIQEELQRRGARPGIYVVSNGIDTRRYAYVERKGVVPVFLYTGRLVESKHVDVALKAFARMRESTRAKLWIVGRGPQERLLKAYVKGEGIAKDVRFLGLVEHGKMPAIYRKADVFVTASTIETEGITTLEAMATGLPVVGVDARATPLLVKKGCGFIAPVGDSERLAEHMGRLARDRALRTAMGRAASRRAGNFEIGKMHRKLLRAYRDVIGQGSA